MAKRWSPLKGTRVFVKYLIPAGSKPGITGVVTSLSRPGKARAYAKSMGYSYWNTYSRGFGGDFESKHPRGYHGRFRRK